METNQIDWLTRGLQYRTQGLWPDAILCFEKASKEKENPRHNEAYYFLGEAWWGLAQIDKAATAWRRGYDQDNKNLPCLQALADALMHLGQLEEAGQFAQTVLSYRSDDARALWINGMLAFRAQKAEEGENALPFLLDKHPEILNDIAYARMLTRLLDGLHEEDNEKAVKLLSYFDEEKRTALPGILKAGLARAFLRFLPNVDTDVRLLLSTLVADSFLPQDEDGLRSLAWLLSEKGLREEAAPWTEIFARKQEEKFERQRQNAEVPPSNWSRRTYGALRIAWLLPGDTVRALLAPLAETIIGSGLFLRFDVWSVNHHQQALAARPAAEDVVMVRALPAEKPAEKLALFDYDILIDGAGLCWPCHTFFVEKPARQIWSAVSMETLALPFAWADKTFGDFSSLWEALRKEAKNLSETSSLTAQAFFAQRDTALRAHQGKDFETAQTIYQALLQEQPDMAALHFLTAMLAYDMRNDESAREHFELAVRSAPNCGKTHEAFAEYLMEHDIDLAAAVVDEGMKSAPQSMMLARVAGKIAMQRGDIQWAETMFIELLRADPTCARLHFELGVVLQGQNRLQEAGRSYQRALLFEPEMIEAHFNLGALFQKRNLLEAARDAYRFVLNKEPTHTQAYMQLGEVLAASGDIRGWFANFKNFQTSCPSSILMMSQGLEASQFMGNYRGVEYFLERLRKLDFKAENNTELIDALDLIQYQLLFFDIDPDVSLKMARLYDEAMRKTFGVPLPRKEKRHSGKIRIGYLSADLRDHVMGRMVWHATRYHDKSKFELFFYSLSESHDFVTENLKNLADHFAVLADLGEHDAARRIDQDDLDILVDLSTNTKGAKPGILALKPARVQITHIASAGTLGLSTIDFKLTDQFADLPEMQQYQIEPFLAMQGCVYPYHHVAAATEHPYHRAALGIAEDAVLLGAFVTPMKLSARCLTLWKKVLDRIPQAKLIFSPITPAFGQIYRHLMGQVEIAEDRYLFLPIPNGGEPLRQARYQIIDFVLDPMPFGNVNGALEPLDAGVPIVTLVGQRHGERTVYSILKNLGETRTIAESGNDYVDIAVRLATDTEFMRDVRAGIRKGLAHSPLTDMKQHCRYLEEAYITALAQKAPQALAESGFA